MVPLEGFGFIKFLSIKNFFFDIYLHINIHKIYIYIYICLQHSLGWNQLIVTYMYICITMPFGDFGTVWSQKFMQAKLAIFRKIFNYTKFYANFLFQNLVIFP